MNPMTSSLQTTKGARGPNGNSGNNMPNGEAGHDGDPGVEGADGQAGADAIRRKRIFQFNHENQHSLEMVNKKNVL